MKGSIKSTAISNVPRLICKVFYEASKSGMKRFFDQNLLVFFHVGQTRTRRKELVIVPEFRLKFKQIQQNPDLYLKK